MTLVAATPSHAAALAAIHAESFPPPDRWDRDAIAALLAQPGIIALIDPAGGMVIARVAFDEAEILTLAVCPGARRSGLGRALMDEACRCAARAGAASMFLEVSDRNAAALRLYGSCGFVQVGLRRDYYSNGSSALVMRKTLEYVS
jgi:ribosomal-protein-alanine N-acetyltransferase